MKENAIIVEGVKHVLTKDDKTNFHCKECSLEKICANVSEFSICGDMFCDFNSHFEIEQ